MMKWVALLAFAAAHVSSASACGWRGERCCNVQENNPNIGVCYDDRSVCWEGRCMDCGHNGQIRCPTGPACAEGNVENADGWCTVDQSQPWVDVCHPACTGRKACHNSRCIPCGDNGQPKCEQGRACNEGNVVNQDGWCSTAPHCGWENEACCANHECLATGTTCRNGTCKREREQEMNNAACGDPDWPCCNAAQRAALGTDDSCSKTRNGVCCNGVCKQGSCGGNRRQGGNGGGGGNRRRGGNRYW